MPTVRRRYHYGCVLLDPNVVGNTRALCGNSVNTINHMGLARMLPLGGFRQATKNKICIERVSICDIDAYTADEPLFGRWTYFGENTLLRGFIERDRVFIELQSNLPIAFCSLPRKTNVKPVYNNIRNIKDYAANRQR